LRNGSGRGIVSEVVAVVVMTSGVRGLGIEERGEDKGKEKGNCTYPLFFKVKGQA
jgi:hypothetical protein